MKKLEKAVLLLIILNIIVIILESVDIIYNEYGRYFRLFEVFSIVVFSVEYVTRVASAFKYGVNNGFKYIFSFMAIIDLVAILPFYLPFILIDLRIFENAQTY